MILLLVVLMYCIRELQTQQYYIGICPLFQNKMCMLDESNSMSKMKE